MSVAPAPPAPPPRPPRAPGARRRAGAGDRQLLVVLALDDVLLDRRADLLPAGVRLRLRRAGLAVGGYDYVEFVGTGTVATAVLFSSAFPAMFGTFIKYKFQHTYDAILAAPVDTEELVTAEALWIATRAGIYGCVPLLVAIVFGLDPAWGMLTVPFIAFLSGFGWACFGICIAGFASSIENFSYIISAVLTPLFLVAGTFFPLTQLPGGRRSPAPSTRSTAASSSSATPPSASRAGTTSACGGTRRLRARHVAGRDPRDDAQARRLGERGGCP